ncbi:MAG: protein kinase [Myxococcaceae bacterium]|nr:protein kinase [Myxococcaceae bacterium]
MGHTFHHRFESGKAFQSSWEESLHGGELFVLTPASPDIGDAVVVELAVGEHRQPLEAEVIGLETDLAGQPGVRVAMTPRSLPALRAFADKVVGAMAREALALEDTASPHEAATVKETDAQAPGSSERQAHVRDLGAGEAGAASVGHGDTHVSLRPSQVSLPRLDDRPSPATTGVLPPRPQALPRPLESTGVLPPRPEPTGMLPPRPPVTPAAVASPPPAGVRLGDTNPVPRITPSSGDGPGASGEVRLKPGDVIGGRFQVEAHIGEGGMGEVYRATHVYLKRTVALKVLHRRLVSNQDAWARFQREAELVSQLEGPNIVRTFDFGRLDDGQPFLSMEFVEGETLDKMLDRGPLEVKDAATVLAQVCEGLAEAHALGIVHRDLKPPNIMMGRRRDGRVIAKILDFGIARLAAAGQEKLTATGAVIGTPSYLAPEQAQGGDIDARTDLYSLGCVAYELLTGRVPFKADSLARLILMHLQERPRPLEAYRPSLGEWPAVNEVVLKALEKDPKARFQSVTEFAEALSEAVGGKAKASEKDTPASEPAWGVEKMPLITAPPPQSLALAPAPTPQPPPGIGARPGLSGLTPAFVPRPSSTSGQTTASIPPGETTRGVSGLQTAYVPPGGLQAPQPRLAQPTSLAASDYANAGASEGRLGRLGEVLAQFNFPLSPDRVAKCEALRATMPGSLPIAWVLAIEPLRAQDPTAFGQLLTVCTDVALEWGGLLDDVTSSTFVFVFFGLGAQARCVLAAQEVRERLEVRLDGEKADAPALKLGISGSRLRADPDGAIEGEAVGAAKALAKGTAAGRCVLARGFANAVNDLLDLEPVDDDVVQVVGRKPVAAKAMVTVGFDAVAQALDARVGALLRGEVAPLVVTGPRRAGRTQVAQEFAVRAQQQGAFVLFSSGLRGGGGSSLAELVCQLCHVPFSARHAGLGPALDKLGLQPAQREAVLLACQLRVAPTPVGGRQAAFALRLAVAAAAQQRPVVLVFDGLDQTDESSVEAFAELCATSGKRELLVGFTTAEQAGAFGKTQQVALPGLTPADVDTLLTGFLGNPPSAELRDALLSRSRGLPGVLVDFALLTAERGALRPRGDSLVLEGSVPQVDNATLPQARLKAVGTRVCRLLEVVAALGEAADGATAAKALPGIAQAAWGRAVTSRLLRSAGHGRVALAPGFEGPLATAPLVGGKPLAQRLAVVLAELSRTNPTLAPRVAEQLSRAGDTTRAGQAWKAVAERALAERDLATVCRAQQGMAEALASHAYASSRQAVTARLELFSRAAICALLLRDKAKARALLDAANELADQSQVDCIEYRLAAARVLRFEGRHDEAQGALDDALAGSQGTAAAAACLAEVGEVQEAANDLGGAVETYQQALAVADGFLPIAPWHGELDFRARLESRIGGVLMQQQQFPRARPFLQAAVERWKAAQAPLHAARVMANLGTLCVQTNAFKEATQWFGAAATTAEAGGDTTFQARQLVSLCRVLAKMADPRLPSLAVATVQLASTLGWDEGVKAARGFLKK